MTGWKISAPLIFMVIWSGCVTTKKVAEERTLSADEVLRRVREREEQIHTVQGNGSITFESPDVSGTGSFTASVRKPDSAKVEIKGPFGIRIGTLAVSREEAVVYDWRAKKASIGPPDEEAIESIVRFKMRFDDLLHAFTGDFLSFASNDSLLTFTNRDGNYVFRFRSQEMEREYYVDGGTFLISSYRLLDADGSASLIAFAERPEEIEGIEVPTLLRVIMPKERRSLTLAYGNIRINEEVECSFAIPEDARIVRRQ